MPLVDLESIANDLPHAWKSTILGRIGHAQIKVLKMDESAYAEEVHDYDEALLVVSGRMLLEVAGEEVVVNAGQMFIAPAGIPHSVLPGSTGSLVIIDVQDLE